MGWLIILHEVPVAVPGTHRGWGIGVTVLLAMAVVMVVNGSSWAGSCSACEAVPLWAVCGSCAQCRTGRVSVLAATRCSHWHVPRCLCLVPSQAVKQKRFEHGGPGGARSMDCLWLLCPTHLLLSPQRWQPSGRSW